MFQSPGIEQILNRGIPDFPISGQSFVNENYQNQFRTCHDIDMKLIPVIKPNKKNPPIPKRFEDDVISTDCDVIVFFLIYGQIPDAWSIKLRFTITITFYLTKSENRTKKPPLDG